MFLLIASYIYSRENQKNILWVQSIHVSSTLKSNTAKYQPHFLLDQSHRSWCEGKEGNGVGEKITIRFAEKYFPMAKKPDALYIYNGYGDKKFWPLNNRVRELKINGKIFSLADHPNAQKIPLSISHPILTLEIVSIYPGKKWQDTCLTEIAFTADKLNNENSRSYAKITQSDWNNLSLPGGEKMNFLPGYFFSTEIVPCGDETCPRTSHGSCVPKQKSQFQCNFLYSCEPDRKGGEKCTDMEHFFQLKIIKNIPIINYQKKSFPLTLIK